MSRSRKHTLCPRALRARTSARNVVACPLPHEEVMERPKITMSKGFVMYLVFSVQPLCSLCLCGYGCVSSNHRDTENTQIAQRRNLSHYGISHFKNNLVVEQSLQLQRAVLISVFSKHALPRRFAD